MMAASAPYTTPMGVVCVKKGTWDRLVSMGRQVADMRLPLYAANVCYFLVLSIFPGLLLVLAALRYTPVSATDLIRMLENLVPAALMPAVERLIVSTYYNATGTMVSVSALATLWSASRGVYGLLMGLNRVYGVREDRGFLRTRLISAVYMVLILIVLVLTLIVQVFGTDLIRLLESSTAPAAVFLSSIIDWRLTILLAAQTMVFTLVYMVMPNQPNGFWDSLPGAVAAALGWQIFSNLFSVYVDRSADYTTIYGSVYAMALGMLWLYFCTMILLCGGVLNRCLIQWKKS